MLLFLFYFSVWSRKSFCKTAKETKILGTSYNKNKSHIRQYFSVRSTLLHDVAQEEL